MDSQRHRGLAAARSFPQLLDVMLSADPGRPMITFYDDDSGERTELSVATYANWVAKTANLLIEEYLLEEGDTLLLDLPTHWLVPVFLGAAWQAGVAVTHDPAESAHLVVTGPVADAHIGRDVPTLATALAPFAGRYPHPLPDGVDDFGLLWPGQPDAWLGAHVPEGATVACRHHARSHTQQQLIDDARDLPWEGHRLLTDRHPGGECGELFLSVLVRGGSLVLVRNPDETSWPARTESERATDVLRSS